jgi:hypothetical protein
MPTGLTQGVHDGKITDFVQFAHTCARGTGILITMRDEPEDAPFPTSIEPSPYHAESIAKLKDKILAVEAMTNRQCANASRREHNRSKKGFVDTLVERSVVKFRYNEMLKKVQRWCPPSSHADFKQLMVEQLTRCIESDCDTDYYAERLDSHGKPKSGTAWRESTLSGYRQDLEYHEKQLAKETELAAFRTKWLQDLNLSLNMRD